MRFTKSLLLVTVSSLTLTSAVFAASPDWSVYAKTLQRVKAGIDYDWSLNSVGE